MRLRWSAWWIPFFLVSSAVWILAIIGARSLICKSQELPAYVILGDKECQLRYFEMATFEPACGGKVYVIRLPKEVVIVPTIQGEP